MCVSATATRSSSVESGGESDADNDVVEDSSTSFAADDVVIERV